MVGPPGGGVGRSRAVDRHAPRNHRDRLQPWHRRRGATTNWGTAAGLGRPRAGRINRAPGSLVRGAAHRLAISRESQTLRVPAKLLYMWPDIGIPNLP